MCPPFIVERREKLYICSNETNKIEQPPPNIISVNHLYANKKLKNNESTMAMHEYIDSFESYLIAERNCSQATAQEYIPTLVSFVNFMVESYGISDWKEVDSTHIREWVVSLMGRGLSAYTVGKKLSGLRSFYRFMLTRGYLTANPMRKVVGPKKEKRLPVFVREGEMDKLLDHITFPDDFMGKRDHLILLTFYTTGIRLAELVGMDVQSVDFYTNTIKVLGKRNKERVIPFGHELREALKEYIALREKWENGKNISALFVGKKGERINRVTVREVVHHYLSEVTTIKKRSPHVLRHSFATAMLNNGAELEVVKQLLGHESIATTEIYTHTTFEELKKEYAKAHPRSDDED